MVAAIRFEFSIGRNRLGPEYSSLFTGSIDLIVKKNTNFHIQWLASVWAGRDAL